MAMGTNKQIKEILSAAPALALFNGTAKTYSGEL